MAGGGFCVPRSAALARGCAFSSRRCLCVQASALLPRPVPAARAAAAALSQRARRCHVRCESDGPLPWARGCPPHQEPRTSRAVCGVPGAEVRSVLFTACQFGVEIDTLYYAEKLSICSRFIKTNVGFLSNAFQQIRSTRPTNNPGAQCGGSRGARLGCGLRARAVGSLSPCAQGAHTAVVAHRPAASPSELRSARAARTGSVFGRPHRFPPKTASARCDWFLLLLSGGGQGGHWATPVFHL